MKRLLFVFLMMNILPQIHCQGIALSKEIETNFQHGLSYRVDRNSPVKSIFENARIINISTDANNNRNLGVYVETMVQLTYDYKGVPFIDEVYVIYSNLSRINVEIDQIINSDTIIGYGGGSGTPLYKNSDLFVYIYTKKISPFLGGRTRNQFYEAYGVFWWDPQTVLGN
jgi:hypothetical protein